MSDLELSQQADGLDANADPETTQKLERLFKQCHTLLGGSSIDVHLEDEDYDVAFDKAVQIYRNFSSRSVYSHLWHHDPGIWSCSL